MTTTGPDRKSTYGGSLTSRSSVNGRVRQGSTVGSGRTTAGRTAAGRTTTGRNAAGNPARQTTDPSGRKPAQETTEEKKRQEMIDRAARAELRKREKRRKLLIVFCAVAAVLSLGYYGLYQYFGYRTDASSEDWAAIKAEAQQNATTGKKPKKTEESEEVVVHKTGAKEIPDVLEEYQPLLLRNASLIGWITIPDTNIDYPVMQTSNNDYYLDHNFNQEYDKNGCIFMDCNCDVVDRSTNLILYGHHMKSGKMFGSLDNYRSESFYRDHKEFTFDTIYEHGVYAVAYVFRSQIYTEDEITFKYYQFINANSEMEFDSNMQAMAEMSLYTTGITPKWGDQLVTLSTCDQATSSEARFVVVGVKIM